MGCFFSPLKKNKLKGNRLIFSSLITSLHCNTPTLLDSGETFTSCIADIQLLNYTSLKTCY